MTEPNSDYSRLAAAFVRGQSRLSGHPALPNHLLHTPLAELTAPQQTELITAGLAAELPLYPFKRTMPLPRVTWALAVLQTIQPTSLLDIGSGRGTFLWPLLDAFPHLPVTAIDADAQRFQHLRAVQLGGVETLQVEQADATALPFADDHLDVVTLLEVLEHIPLPAAALAEAVHVGRPFCSSVYHPKLTTTPNTFTSSTKPACAGCWPIAASPASSGAAFPASGQSWRG